MTAIEILDRLKELGVEVELIGDQVQVTPVNLVPEDLLDEAKAHKQELIHELSPWSDLLARLQSGHLWLLDQHRLWQSGDSAATDTEFSRVWNGWWELDQRLRADHGFQGCIYGPNGTCPDGFPCKGCAEVPTPGVTAQVALGEINDC